MTKNDKKETYIGEKLMKSSKKIFLVSFLIFAMSSVLFFPSQGIDPTTMKSPFSFLLQTMLICTASILLALGWIAETIEGRTQHPEAE